MGMMNSLFVQHQILNDGKTQGQAKHFIKIYICKYVVKIGFGGTQPPLLAFEFCAAGVNPVELSVPALYRRDPW